MWKVIIDFVLDQKVDKLVLGASSRNAFTRCRIILQPLSQRKLQPFLFTVYFLNCFNTSLLIAILISVLN